MAHPYDREASLKYLLMLLLAFGATAAHARDLTDEEKALFIAAVKERLKDPDSAQFKWMPMRDEPNAEMYCGLVNSKNSYGGYTGFSPYQAMIVGENRTAAILISIGSGRDAAVTAKVCADSGYPDLEMAQ